VPDSVLTDYQIDLGGTLLGPGTAIDIIEVTGIGRPPVRDNDADQPSADGVFPGPDYYAARQIQIDAAIKVPADPAGCLNLLAQLEQGCSDAAVRLVGGTTMALRLQWPGRPTKRAFGRVRKIDPTMRQAIHGYVPLDIEFLATDPLWYADTESTTEIPLGWLTGGGFAAPVVAPIYVQNGTVAANRPGWVTNSGTADTWPVIRITGPCANASITHVPTGRQLKMPTLNLAAGQWVQIYTRPGQRSVVRENGGNAAALLSPDSRLDQFSLPPGQSEMRWTAFDNTNSARLRLTWRDAYTAL
jgi:hypothetical protein